MAGRGEALSLNPPPGVRTEGVEAGLDARKACVEERSVVGNYVSTAEVRLTTQTGPSHPYLGVGGPQMDRLPNATVGGGFRFLACPSCADFLGAMKSLCPLVRGELPYLPGHGPSSVEGRSAGLSVRSQAACSGWSS